MEHVKPNAVVHKNNNFFLLQNLKKTELKILIELLYLFFIINSLITDGNTTVDHRVLFCSALMSMFTGMSSWDLVWIRTTHQ